MAIDFARVKAHLARLRELAPDEPSWWQTGPVWTGEQLVAFEKQYTQLPDDYRAWLVEIGDGGAGFLAPRDGFISLARFPPEREALVKPFRIAKPSVRVSYPIKGALYLGERSGRRTFLIVRGKRAGEVWVDATATVTGEFGPIGTFAELTQRWITSSASEILRRTKPAEATPVIDRGGTLEAWRRMCDGSGLVGWLREGVDVFAQLFDQIEPARQRDATAYAANGFANETERWLLDPRLASTAALVLMTCLDRINTPRTRVEKALAAISDHGESLDLSPNKIAELISAYETTKTYEDAQLYWLERELRAAGRLDEAVAMFRIRPRFQAAEYVDIARALIAAGRADEAIALGDEISTESGIGFGWARGWILVEAGRIDEGRKMLAIEVSYDSRVERQQIVAALHRDGPPPKSPDDISFTPPSARPFPLFAVTVHYELVALLYAIADEPHDAIDAAIRALSSPGIKRHPREYANHLVNLRITEALTGKSPSSEPPLRADYSTDCARRLAGRLLARLPSLGIHVGRYG